jgi:hypothetical protein
MSNKKQALLTLHEHQGFSRIFVIVRVARPFSVLYCLSVCALFVLLVFAQYCQYIWIVHSWWSLRFSLTFINILQLMHYARACSLHNRYPSHKCMTAHFPVLVLGFNKKCRDKINVREYRSDNQIRTIQRNWQHSVHKTKTNKIKTQRNMCWGPLYAVIYYYPFAPSSSCRVCPYHKLALCNC